MHQAGEVAAEADRVDHGEGDAARGQRGEQAQDEVVDERGGGGALDHQGGVVGQADGGRQGEIGGAGQGHARVARQLAGERLEGHREAAERDGGGGLCGWLPAVAGFRGPRGEAGGGGGGEGGGLLIERDRAVAPLGGEVLDGGGVAGVGGGECGLQFAGVRLRGGVGLVAGGGERGGVALAEAGERGLVEGGGAIRQAGVLPFELVAALADQLLGLGVAGAEAGAQAAALALGQLVDLAGELGHVGVGRLGGGLGEAA